MKANYQAKSEEQNQALENQSTTESNVSQEVEKCSEGLLTCNNNQNTENTDLQFQTESNKQYLLSSIEPTPHIILPLKVNPNREKGILNRDCSQPDISDIRLLTDTIKDEINQSAQHMLIAYSMLKKVRDEELYKALEYKNFQDFVELELHLDRSTAYKYIKIIESENFEIIKENANIGMAKLYIISLLEQSILEKLLAKINLQDITVKKLKERITQLAVEKKQQDEKLNIISDAYASEKKRSALYRNELRKRDDEDFRKKHKGNPKFESPDINNTEENYNQLVLKEHIVGVENCKENAPLKDDSIAYSGISNNNPTISGSTKEITIDTENKELDRLHSQYSIVVEKIIESIINCSPNAIASEKEKNPDLQMGHNRTKNDVFA